MPKTYLSDLMSDEDKAKMKAWEQAQFKAKSEWITKEWYMLSELGYYIGWGAVEAVINDKITLDFARLLIEGARKVHDSEVIDMAMAVAAGFRGNTEKSKSFDKLMASYMQSMKEVA